MIPLQPDRPLGFLFVPAASSRASQFDIFVNNFAIVHNFYHRRVRDFLALAVKARSFEGDVECLPLARWFAGIDARGMAFDVPLVGPAAVDAATLRDWLL